MDALAVAAARWRNPSRYFLPRLPSRVGRNLAIFQDHYHATRRHFLAEKQQLVFGCQRFNCWRVAQRPRRHPVDTTLLSWKKEKHGSGLPACIAISWLEVTTDMYLSRISVTFQDILSSNGNSRRTLPFSI